MKPTTVLSLIGSSLAVGLVVGWFLHTPSPVPVAESALRKPSPLPEQRQREVLQALTRTLSRMAQDALEDKDTRSPSGLEATQKQLPQAVEKFSAPQLAIPEGHESSGFEAFRRDPNIQAQIQQARQQVAEALLLRYGGSVTLDHIRTALANMDAQQEQTEHPMKNPFSTEQQKMEALPYKDLGALSDTSK